jgi:AAA domain-containing protein
VSTKTRALSLLIHAASKVGKSTLSSTAPVPILVLDAEGSWRFIKVRKIYWDPMTQPIPRHDGTWDACIVTVTQWVHVLQVYRHLTQAEHDFISVVIDSITEVQRRLKANLKGTEAMQMQDWGQLLTQMDAQIRSFRDLTMLPGPVACVVMIAETKQVNGRWVPYMQGQIGTALPYLVDICGYLYPDFEPDANGQPTKKIRRLFVGSHPNFESGERVQGTLGDAVTEPNIADMIETIFANVNTMEVNSNG